MVFHVSNYMRETNVWMIRKMRWIFWSIALSVPIYRNTYWDYLGRRTAWVEYLRPGTVNEKIERAESLRADWGFHPRYEAKYPFSIKTHKYANQTRKEALEDLPRLHTRSSMIYGQEKLVEPKHIRDGIMILKEHNRPPGVFDYNYPQYFFSTFPEEEYESYYTIGGESKRRLHSDE